jgi:hypothetical protein
MAFAFALRSLPALGGYEINCSRGEQYKFQIPTRERPAQQAAVTQTPPTMSSVLVEKKNADLRQNSLPNQI